MPSPFPGMDPYLEDPATRSGVHAAILAAIFERLGPAVRPRYAVRFVERLIEAGDPRSVQAEPEYERSLHVVDVRDRSIVTVIELLSPTNKTPGSAGRASFLRKRREVLASDASWMEIDLLREGQRTPRPINVPETEYRVYLVRGGERQTPLVWPIRLQDRLPTVAVPLRDGDDDVPLDLQAAVSAAIERGSYDLDADYLADPMPPLTEPAAAWARALVAPKA